MAAPGEESDGSIVPAKAAKTAGGTGPYSTTRPLRQRTGDCGDTSNTPKDPGAATGAVPTSQEGPELPSLRAARQGLPRRRAGPRLRASKGERWGTWRGWGDLRGHRDGRDRGLSAGTERGAEDEAIPTRTGEAG